MKHVFTFCASILLSSILISLKASAQPFKIVDKLTGNPLAFATITIKPNGGMLIANEYGVASIEKDILEPTDTLYFTYTGYTDYVVTLSALWEMTGSKENMTVALSLPPIVFQPPNVDSLLVYAMIKTMNQVMKQPQWQGYQYRVGIQQGTAQQYQPMVLHEYTGDLFTNAITPGTIVGSKNAYAWFEPNHERYIGKYRINAPEYIAFNDSWMTYDFKYYLPFSPQLFDKRITKIFDDEGNATHYSISMKPKKFGTLSTLKLADGKMTTVAYYSFLNTVRNFYIAMEDTTITMLHVTSRDTYTIPRSEKNIRELQRTITYQFCGKGKNGRYLDYAQLDLTWEDKKIIQQYHIKHQVWLQEPRTYEATSLGAIQAKTKIRKVGTFTYNRFGTETWYTLESGESPKPIQNDETYWRNIVFPDFGVAKRQYQSFSALPDFKRFIPAE